MTFSHHKKHDCPENRYTPAEMYLLDNYSNTSIMKKSGETFS